MTYYYGCKKCDKVFATKRLGDEHSQKDGHGTYRLSKRTPVDHSSVVGRQ